MAGTCEWHVCSDVHGHLPQGATCRGGSDERDGTAAGVTSAYFGVDTHQQTFKAFSVNYWVSRTFRWGVMSEQEATLQAFGRITVLVFASQTLVFTPQTPFLHRKSLFQKRRHFSPLNININPVFKTSPIPSLSYFFHCSLQPFLCRGHMSQTWQVFVSYVSDVSSTISGQDIQGERVHSWIPV